MPSPTQKGNIEEMNNTKELAKFKWHSILFQLGIDKKFLTGKHGPCPLCGGIDRFRFEPTKENGSYFCSFCGAGSGLHLLAQIKGVTHEGAWRLVESVMDMAEETKPQPMVNREERIRKIQAACQRLTVGGQVDIYLRGRGICFLDLPPFDLAEVKTSNNSSMMVARFAKGNKLAGLHITFIRDGKKDESNGSAKKMYGLTQGGLNGSAIRLHPAGTVSRIIVAEGIETTLSVAQKYGLPAWACGSAGLMEVLEVPDAIKEVIIAGDNDASFTGQAAAYILAKRLTRQGKSCTVLLPKEIGDFNDQK